MFSYFPKLSDEPPLRRSKRRYFWRYTRISLHYYAILLLQPNVYNNRVVSVVFEDISIIMSSLSLFWNRGRTKRVDREPTEDGLKEGESLLTPDHEKYDSLRMRRTGTKRSGHLLIWIIGAVLSALAIFYLGFVLGNSRREGPWGSFEKGFIEERVVSKY